MIQAKLPESTLRVISKEVTMRLKQSRWTLILAALALTVFSSVTAHDDGTNHSSHGHKPHEECGDCGGLLIVSIILGLLLLGSCFANVYQFRLRHGNVITAEVEYNSFS